MAQRKEAKKESNRKYRERKKKLKEKPIRIRDTAQIKSPLDLLEARVEQAIDLLNESLRECELQRQSAISLEIIPPPRGMGLPSIAARVYRLSKVFT